MNLNESIYYGEVIEVHLTDNDPEYQTYIKCRLLEQDSYITARPINKQIKYIPLKGEIVLLLYGPSSYYSVFEKHYEFYYLFPINLHENVNHNSLFDATSTGGNKNEQKFGEDFEEQTINDLQAYEGDTILQGRFGNAIRFSKTNIKNGLNHPSTWLKGSSTYSPIITISNNIKKVSNTKNKHTTEDINEDGSSIFIAYNQKVNLSLASVLFDSFRNKPEDIAEFIDNQILINSDRIVLNAKTDVLFLNAKKSVSISSDKDINIDSKEETIISSKKTFIGNKDATEPLLFGEKTDAWLKELLDLINQTLTSLAAHIHPTGTGPSGPPVDAQSYSPTYTNNLQTIKNKIEQLKSKKNFVD